MTLKKLQFVTSKLKIVTCIAFKQELQRIIIRFLKKNIENLILMVILKKMPSVLKNKWWACLHRRY